MANVGLVVVEEGLSSSVEVVDFWGVGIEDTLVEEPEHLRKLPDTHCHCQLLNLEVAVEVVMQLFRILFGGNVWDFTVYFTLISG